MKFFAVAVVAVVFCAAAVHADDAPYDPPQFRELLKCVDGVFDVVSEKYSGLAKYHPEYKALAEQTNLKLDECERAETSDTKNECLSAAAEAYFSYFDHLRIKLLKEEDSEKLVAELGFLLMTKCPR